MVIYIYIYIKPKPLKHPQFSTSAQYLNKMIEINTLLMRDRRGLIDGNLYIYIKPKPLKLPKFSTSAQYLNKIIILFKLN